jgi:hypothetical protein
VLLPLLIVLGCEEAFFIVYLVSGNMDEGLFWIDEGLNFLWCQRVMSKFNNSAVMIILSSFSQNRDSEFNFPSYLKIN